MTVANVVTGDGGPATQIATNTGQAGAANQAQITTAGSAQQEAAPTTTPASQMTAAQSQGTMQNALSGMSGDQGQIRQIDDVRNVGCRRREIGNLGSSLRNPFLRRV